MRRFTAKTADIGARADVFVAQKYPQFSRSSLARLFDEDKVVVNSKAVKAGYRLKQRDRLAVDDKVINKVPQAVELPIIYEDDDVVVIDKPAGILSHSKGLINEEATVASSLAGKLDSRLTGNRAGIVHRLDRWTSGVMIIAKTPEALTYLQKQFASRTVKKIYKAVVEGKPEQVEAIIDAPIARNPKKPQTFVVSSDGKPAQTHFKITSTTEVDDKLFSSLVLEPATGRTHQLRVHLAYIGHPIVGDSVYGEPGYLMLHAESLTLRLPSGAKRTFVAPLPARFDRFRSDGK